MKQFEIRLKLESLLFRAGEKTGRMKYFSRFRICFVRDCRASTGDTK